MIQVTYGYYIGPLETSSSACNLYKFVGANDLSINDIVVKSSVGNTACIKARFSLAIKVESLLENYLSNNNNNDGKEPNNDDNNNNNDGGSGDQQHESSETTRETHSNGDMKVENKMVLGYLPLDSVIAVEDSCPEMISSQKTSEATTATTTIVASSSSDSNNNNKQQASPLNRQNSFQTKDNGQETSVEEPKELNMIVKFECGTLNFEFKKDDEQNIYLSTIKGNVQLGKLFFYMNYFGLI